MRRLIGISRYVADEFGPLIAFWVLAAALGLKAGIAGSIAVIVAGVLWRLVRRRAFTRIYILVAVLTVVLGVVDLLSDTPAMIIYESVITNVVTGIAFVIGASGRKPMIQEMAEQRAEIPNPDRADTRRFFQLFTLLWAAYFFVKAAFYLWLARTMPLAEALAVRSLVGGVSLGLMIGISVTQGKRLFLLCRKWGLLPKVPAETPTA